MTLPVPPRTSLVINVEQINAYIRPAELPDLAVDPRDVKREGTNVLVTVHNIGNGDAENVVVRLLNGEKTLREKTIDRLEAPIDFKPKRTTVTFTGIQPSRNHSIVVDPGNVVPEILEENNRAAVSK